MTEDEVKARVRDFFTRFLKSAEVRDDEDIFASGLVNSLFALQMVIFVEKVFQLSLGEEDLQIGNFRSIDAVTGLILKKRWTAPIQS
jgi:acyl carrier protein